MTETMRRWEMDGIGRDQLVLRERPIPEPGPGEALVKVGAVSLNYRDKMVVESGRGLPLTFPFTPCSDLAGTVVGTGAGAARFKVGDDVISTFTPEWVEGRRGGNARTPEYRTLGGYFPGVLADYVSLPEDWLVRAPATLDHSRASTLPCAGVTAWFALVERGRVHAGQTVLVKGTGGVSLFGVQIAKMHGAQVILSGSVDKVERASALGVDHAVDRRQDAWLETVLKFTDDRGADHILEVVGGPQLADAIQAAAVGGHVHQIGALEGFELSAPAMPLMLKDVTIHGIGTGHRRALEALVAAVDRTGLEPVIDSRHTLADFPTAIDRLDDGPFGKVVVELT